MMLARSPYVLLNRLPRFAQLPIDPNAFLGIDSIPVPVWPEGYRKVRIFRNDQTELNAARWLAGAESKLHGHAGSSAAYIVIRGAVEEERFIPEGDGYRYERTILRAGERTILPPGGIHQVRALEDSITIHHYTPPGETTTEEVPPQVMRLLVRARGRQHQGAAFAGAESPNLLETVEQHLDVWAEREAAANRDGELRLPPETLAEMRQTGIFAAPVPVELGGWGTSLRDAAEALRRVGQRAPATALALVMPLGNAATTRIPVAAVAPEARAALAQGQRWIAEKALAGKILAVANSEPGAGGDLKNTKTVAHRSADGVYRLTGRKSFATFGRDADYFLCAARRPDLMPGERAEAIDGFFVASDAPGLVIDDRWNPVGMRPTASVGLSLEDAASEAIMGYPGCLEGVSARHWSTVLFAAVFLGVGEGALREGLKLVSGDAVWAHGTLAECQLSLDAAAGFLEAVSSDEPYPLPPQARERTNRLKTFVAKTSAETALQVAMISGGRSYTPQHPVFRFLCDSLAGPLLRPPLPQAMDAIVRQHRASQNATA